MAIWGSFTTARMAMDAHSYQMETLGSNIANVNTTSYKATETLYQTQKGYGTPRFNFFGVKTTDRRHIDTQGTLQVTGRNLDLAINGRGFLVTNTKTDGSGQTYYTRDGALGMRPVKDGSMENYLVSRAGDYVMGWEASSDGKVFSPRLGAVNFANFSVVGGIPTSRLSLQGNVSATTAAGNPVYQSISVIRSSGDSDPQKSTVKQDLTLKFTPDPQVKNNWTLAVEGVKSATITPPVVEFSGNGKLLNPKSVQVKITWDDNKTQEITLDLSEVTQFQAPKSPIDLKVTSTDGQLPGVLEDVSIDKHGIIWGIYNNRSSRPIYKLPIATFPSENAMEAYPGNRFRQTPEAGKVQINDLLQQQGIANITSENLETSNVNLEDQFSKMIVTQRAYSSAATVFRTSDEMLQEIRNLKS